MHPGIHAAATPDKPAFVMCASGRSASYRELDEASNRVAHLLRRHGLRRGDGVAIFMENNPRYFELCWGAQRAGLYYTCISSHLTAGEVDYIVADCGAKAVFSSQAMAAVAADLTLPGVGLRLMADGTVPGFEPYEAALAGLPAGPIADESEGADMLYSSGTTGRPKGVRVPLPEEPFGTPTRLVGLLQRFYGFDAASRYLSPAPLYHAAPLRFTLAAQRLGATAFVMERFDAEAALAAIQRHRITHSQWVPTMFVRLLKLPAAVRAAYDVSSLQVAIHAAAPCPVEVKARMIDWWGPVLHEYYAGTEGCGMTMIDSVDWLAHRGSVGRAVIGSVKILDEDFRELPPGGEGTVYFADGNPFSYHGDPAKTAASFSPQGWATLGDVGRLDADGYLYLTDRRAFMIISGGVNIYPQEVENLLVTHPEVMDAAVIGVPDEEFGEAVKAVVQPLDMRAAGPELEARLIAFCRAGLSHLKCPRSVDFEAELPRHGNGKLYKRLLRDRYWGRGGSRIV